MRPTSFNTLIELSLPDCTFGVRPQCFFFQIMKGRGNLKVTRGTLDCRLHGLTRWELIVSKFQDHPLGSTRPLAFDRKASRSPAGVDSPTALAFNEAESRVRGLTQPPPSHSTECEKGRAEVLGTFSAQAPGRSAESLVRRLRGFTPLGLGGA